MNKLKTLIGIGLGAMLMTGVMVGTNVGHFSVFNLTRAQTPYICAGNVRLEPNEDGSYNITHIGAGATTVDLSTLLEQYDVVTISADAFDDCRDTLTSITIDANIPIEDGALSDMANVLDVTFTGDATEINYGHIFQNTEIGTMTIPSNVTTVSQETFYGVTDTTNLIYEGSFNNFWGTKGSDGIFGSLWSAFKTTMNDGVLINPDTGRPYASMPTNIEIAGTNYFIPEDTNRATFFSTTSVYYFKTQPSSNIRTNQLGSNCSFGISNTTYYKNSNEL